MPLHLKPHKIRGHNDAWWYEEDQGITVVQEYRDQEGILSTVVCLIPWRALRGALKRKDHTT